MIAPRWLAAFLLCGSALCGFAQQNSPLPDAPSASADTTPAKKTKLETVRTTVTVLGAPDPISLGESARSVVVMDTQQHPLAYNTVEDYLRTDSSVQINQRGSGGYPADLSIRGTSFEQTLVLLDGFRVNDAQAAHNNLDLPVPLDAMTNIEVLHGAGSTLYGADALGGVADFLTARPAASSLWVSGGGGQFRNKSSKLLSAIMRAAIGQSRLPGIAISLPVLCTIATIAMKTEARKPG